MARKTRNFILTLAVLVVSIGIAFSLASLKKPAERKAIVDKHISIPVIEVNNSQVHFEVPIIGKVNAKQKINLYAEVSGVFESGSKSFLEGIYYKKGETLINVNSDEAIQGLIAKRSSLLNLVTKTLPELKFDYPESYSQWYQYLIDFDINQKTKELPKPINDHEKYYITGKGIYQSYYDIVSSETRLEKYIIKAPFDGVVSESNIKPGDLIRNGQPLGEYFNPANYDLETEVSLADVKLINIGDSVLLFDEYTGNEFTGKVSRIGKNIDQTTQYVKVYISIISDLLIDGQFLTGNIKTTQTNNAFELSRKLIIDDKYVFLVKDTILYKQDITIIRNNYNTALVSGLSDGMLVSTKTSNLHEGLTVDIKL